MKMQAYLGKIFALFVMSAAATIALAQDFPNRLVRVVIPFAPGGSAEVAARIITQGLSDVWGWPVIIEYKAGAGGTIAAAYVAKAAPDGYTIYSGGGAEYQYGRMERLPGPGEHAGPRH